MKLNIDEHLKKQNRTRYWLAKEINMSYPAIKKLADNNSESTKFETLEKLCKALNCSINELLTIDK